MASRAGKALRLPPTRWSDWVSDGGVPGQLAHAVYESYSWAGRPVAAADHAGLPLYWSPTQAARTLVLSLEDYQASFAAVVPRSPRPLRRPRAVLYPLWASGNDVIGDAVLPLAADLRARGVFCGMSYTYQSLASPAVTIKESGNFIACPALPPVGSFVLVTGVDGDGNTQGLNLEQWEGADIRAGEVLYLFPAGTEFPLWSLRGAGGAGYIAWPEHFEFQAGIFQRQAALHDRVEWHGLFFGANGAAEIAQNGARMADMHAAVPEFTYEYRPLSKEDSAGWVAESAAAKVAEFFGL